MGKNGPNRLSLSIYKTAPFPVNCSTSVTGPVALFFVLPAAIPCSSPSLTVCNQRSKAWLAKAS